MINYDSNGEITYFDYTAIVLHSWQGVLAKTYAAVASATAAVVVTAVAIAAAAIACDVTCFI